MSVLDNALRALFVNGCKVEEVWRNASPASTFPAQKITTDLSSFDLVVILSRLTNENVREGLAMCEKNGQSQTQFVLGQNKAPYMTSRYRGLTASATGVQFNAAYMAKSSQAESQDNTAAIPVVIYGIKVLGWGYRIARFIKSLFHRCERGWA